MQIPSKCPPKLEFLPSVWSPAKVQRCQQKAEPLQASTALKCSQAFEWKRTFASGQFTCKGLTFVGTCTLFFILLANICAGSGINILSNPGRILATALLAKESKNDLSPEVLLSWHGDGWLSFSEKNVLQYQVSLHCNYHCAALLDPLQALLSHLPQQSTGVPQYLLIQYLVLVVHGYHGNWESLLKG